MWPTVVLTSLRMNTRTRGAVHIAVSDCRCHPDKVVDWWEDKTMEERLDMIAKFLHIAGWIYIDIIEVRKPPVVAHGPEDNLRRRRSDGVWVVRAYNPALPRIALPPNTGMQTRLPVRQTAIEYIDSLGT